ncbi:MAG: methyltransferase [Chloroflexi bacterium]|nr:methyltransferase [Chloroflexota bacterium]
MPIQTSFVERAAFFSLKMAPSPILDVVGLFAFQAISVAVRQGVFTALAAGPLTPKQLAEKLHCQERGTQMLLEALAAIGYVAQANGRFDGTQGKRYQNTPLTEIWVLPNDAFNLEALVTFWNAAAQDLMPSADAVLQTGERPYDFYEWAASRPELYRAYQQQMMMSAHNAGADVVRKVNLPEQAKSLLDVGGAHGLYSLLFCQQHPNLHATILDSHAGAQMAQENIAQYQMQDRVKTVVGDLWQTDWGDGHDVILLFNLIHHFGAEGNIDLLQRAAAALKPGGRVVILDQIVGNVMGQATNALIRLIAWQYYLLADGRVHERDEIKSWLVQTGFQDIRFIGLSKLPGNSLVIAVKA